MKNNFKLGLVLMLLLLTASFASATDFTADNILATAFTDTEDYDYNVVGGVSRVEGALDGAFEFDGSTGYLKTGDLLEPDYITVSTWFKTSSTGSDMALIADRSYGYALYMDEGNLKNYVWTSSSTYDQYVSTATYNDGNWHHYSMTFDGSEMNTYIDGSLVDTGIISGTIHYNNDGGNTGIGRNGGYDGNYFEGTLDEIKIFSSDLTSTQISTLYNSGSPVENEVAIDDQIFYANFDSLQHDYDIYGGVTGTEGVINGAFEFDGTDDYVTTGTGMVEGLTQASFCTWFNPDSIISTHSLAGEYSGSNDRTFVVDLTNSDEIAVLLADEDGTVIQPTTTNSPISTGVDYHLCWTYNDGDAYVYLDGVEILSDTTTLSGALDMSSKDFYIGQREISTTMYDGSIDEVMVFSDALTLSQVQDLYNSGEPEEDTLIDANRVFYANFNYLNDLSASENLFVATGGLTFDSDENAYIFDGVDDSLKALDATDLDLNGDKTISFWLYDSQTGGGNTETTVFGKSTRNLGMSAHDNSDVYYIRDGTNTFSIDRDHKNEWQMITISESSGTGSIYVNGVLETTNSLNWDWDSTEDLYFGSASDGRYMDAMMSDIKLFDSAKDATYVAELYAEGRNYNAYDINEPEVELLGAYLPKVTEVNQVGSLQINSVNYAPVFVGTVEVTNTTNLSISVTGSVQGVGSDSVANCEIEVDGSQVGYTVTSPPNGDYRSFFINTELVEKDAGNHTVNLNCKKDGSHRFTIESSKMVITQYVKSDGEPLNTDYMELDADITSSSYTQIGSVNFTTSNTTVDDGMVRYVIIEASALDNYDSTGTICLQGQVFGVNSSEYCRYGSAGSRGSGSAFTMVQNVTNETLMEIAIFGKSTTSNGDVELTFNAYEIISHPEEVQSTELDATDITSTSFESVASYVIENSEHAAIASITKASFSIQSDSGAADMQFRISITGDEEVNGTTIYRDVDASAEEGIVTLQEVFTALGVGNYTVNLEAQTSNSDASITGGEMITYTANNIQFSELSYNLTAVDDIYGEPLTNFNLTTGLGVVISDEGTGYIIVPASEANDEGTISKEGYYDYVYSSHDTTTDLEAVLEVLKYRTNVIGEEFLFETPVYEFTINNSYFEGSTTNGTVVIDLPEGNWTFNITNPTGYYNRTNFPVTVEPFDGDNVTVTFTGSVINITAYDVIGEDFIDNFSVTMTSETYGEVVSGSTTTGELELLLNPDVFEVIIDAPGFSLFEQNLTINFSQNTLDAQIYTLNSVNFTVYNAVSNDILTGVNVSVELIGDYASYNYTITDGYYYADLIAPASYTVRTSAEGFEQALSYFSLRNRSTNSVDLYLLNSSDSTDVTINIVDQLDNSPLEGYFVKVFQYSGTTAGYVQTEILETNFEGKVVSKMRLADEFYRFIIENEDGVVVESTDPTYIYETTLTIPVSVGEEVLRDYENIQGVTVSLVYNDGSNNFRYEYSDRENTAEEGCVRLYRVYNNIQEEISYTCNSGSSGILLIPLTPVNGSIFTAKAYVTFDGSEQFMTAETKSFKAEIMDDSNWLFYAFLLTLAMAFAFIWSPAIMVAVLPLPSLLLSLLGLLPIDWGIIIVIELIFIGIAAWLGKRG